ncbi:MAG: hypothetical protein LQ342_002325 [Letrouitia transgressa]|nr:MAG: hypothetical protein LQ342_002325 [Letrouitia transgressa]
MYLKSVVFALLAFSHFGNTTPVLLSRQSCSGPGLCDTDTCPAAPEGDGLHDTTPYETEVDTSERDAIPNALAGDTFLVPADPETWTSLGYDHEDDDWLYAQDEDGAVTTRDLAYEKCVDYYILFTRGGKLIAVNKEDSNEIGDKVNVDHLFELNQVWRFLESLFDNQGLKIAKTTIDGWLTRSKECDNVVQDLKNILNNPVNFLGVDRGINLMKSQLLRDVTVAWADVTFDRAVAMDSYMRVYKPFYLHIAGKVGEALAQKLDDPRLKQACVDYATATLDKAFKRVRDFIKGENGGPTKKTRLEIDSKPLARGYERPGKDAMDLWDSIVNT